jgi:ribonuclease P protein component
VTAGTGRFLKNHRLNKPSDFRNVFNANRRSFDSRFVVLARKNGLGHPRLGLVVSRKKVGNAVTRNRIKRIVRESFRRYLNKLGDYDLVVIPQKSPNPDDRKSMRKSLEKHWSNISK